MRFVVSVMLMLCATSTYAGWEKIGQLDGIEVYIDPTTMRKDGNSRRIWQLHALPSGRVDRVRSMRMLVEIDCKQERSRMLSFSAHSGEMASGEIVANDDDTTRWGYIPPGSFNDILMKIVCPR